VERNLELSIEQTVDVCKHLVAGLELREPETYADCFSILGESGVLEKDASERFQSMVRFRNMLIHVYDRINDEITFDIYTRRLNDFVLFVSLIRRYLEKTGG